MLAILSDFDRAFGPAVDPAKAEMFRQRHRWWRDAAAGIGWEVRVVDTAAVLADPGVLAGVGTVFIDMPVLRPDVYRTVVAACETVVPPGRVFDPPADVDRVLSLAGDYRRLADFPEIATVRTAYVPVPDAVCGAIATTADVDRLLGPALDDAVRAAGLDLAAGVFVRGYFASLRSQLPAYFFANSRPHLAATAGRVVRGLRGGFAVGGLAVREFLTLEEVVVPPDGAVPGGAVPLEIRLTFVDGKSVAASFHGPYEELTDRQKSAVGDRLRADGLPDRLWDVAAKLAGAGLPPNAVADVVFRKGDPTPVVSEFNPLYSSGYRVPTARAWAFANLAATAAAAAGDAALTPAAIRDLAVRLLGEPWDDRGVIVPADTR